MQKTFISNECELICEDIGRKMVVKVIDFEPKKHLAVHVENEFNLGLRWNGRNYVGHSGDLSFVSSGPDITIINKR